MYMLYYLPMEDGKRNFQERFRAPPCLLVGIRQLEDEWFMEFYLLGSSEGRSPPLSFVASAAENLFLMVYFVNAKTKF